MVCAAPAAGQADPATGEALRRCGGARAQLRPRAVQRRSGGGRLGCSGSRGGRAGRTPASPPPPTAKVHVVGRLIAATASCRAVLKTMCYAVRTCLLAPAAAMPPAPRLLRQRWRRPRRWPSASTSSKQSKRCTGERTHACSHEAFAAAWPSWRLQARATVRATGRRVQFAEQELVAALEQHHALMTEHVELQHQARTATSNLAAAEAAIQVCVCLWRRASTLLRPASSR